MVKKKYEELAEREIVASADLTPSRTKMATLPEGAEPLSNAVGAAPGVKLIVEDTVIIALPGVPDEMKSVFELSIPNLIKMRWEPLQVHDADVSVEVRDESELAPLLAQIQGQVPGVQLKSLPKAYGVDTKLRVRVRAEGSTREECIEKVKRAIEKLKELMESR